MTRCAGVARGWNFADVWEWIAEAIPEAPALIHGEVRRNWAEFDRRADAVAGALLESGLHRQEKVAMYLHNGNEYLEVLFAAMKAGLVPVNTNYGYVEDELRYLWDDADAVAVAFHGALTDRVAGVRTRLPNVRVWLWVDDGSGTCPTWAQPFEEMACSTSDRVVPNWGRSGNDLILAYTGGSTGLPRGVMWRQADLYNSFSEVIWRDLPVASAERVRTRVLRSEIRPVGLPATPLFHATGQFVAMEELCQGGSVVTATGREFDAIETLDLIDKRRVSILALAGDHFGKPILEALESHPGRWNLTTLKLVISSGATLSERTKRGILSHHPGVKVVDSLCATEGLFMGTSVSSFESDIQTGNFKPSESTRVIGSNDRDVRPGSGEIGMVAVGGWYQSAGYYKDPVKSSMNYRSIDSKRYAIPGDYAFVNSDGTMTFTGRGSGCITSGQGQVFPEEVEQVLKQHPVICDAAVVGVPDEYFGEIVVAMVQFKDHTTAILEHVVSFVQKYLASYKAPRRIFRVDGIARLPNGKIDYPRMRQIALARANVFGTGERHAQDQLASDSHVD